MFRRILIANRGEIAVRILRACRVLGVETVAVFSTADRDALHVGLADRAVCVGPPAAEQSYLNIAAIITAALAQGCDAVHPGYGFLSENGDFAEACRLTGLVFVGPRLRCIRLMGDKARARRVLARRGVPVLPGSARTLRDRREAHEVAARLGWPVLVKATAGGGGRGLRVVREPGELDGAMAAASSEAERSFRNGGVYLERLVEGARHVEIQVIGDRFGGAIQLGERDCSWQRRHQKVIEESPSPGLDGRLRDAIARSALRVVDAIRYDSVGTVEFLLEPDGRFHFLEMNTRVQVEHPVSELVTGLDVVGTGIRVAAGERLTMGSDDVETRGHAIEVRVNAENPRTGLPSPGVVTALHWPGGPGIRVDTALEVPGAVSAAYDSLIAKIIAHGENRDAARRRLGAALAEARVEGINTNLPLLRELVETPEFVSGRFDTGSLERWLAIRYPMASMAGGGS